MGKIKDEPVGHVINNDMHNAWEHIVRTNPGIKLDIGQALYVKDESQKSTRHDPTLHIDVVHTQVNYLQSEVLTVVEASFSDHLQRQAVIKLVKAAFNKRHNWLDEIVYGSNANDSGKYDADPQSVINGEAKTTQE